MLTERLAEAYRVLKPGGHALIWSIPRTSHWTAWAIEDAGFDVRDCVLHLFGSGFPKSLDVSKAIDKAARGVPQGAADPTSPNHGKYRTTSTEGKRWEGDSGQSYGAGGSRFLATTASGKTTASGTQGISDQDAVVASSLPDPIQDATAADWAGWGTSLKPGQEMWWLARKPMKGTVAANVLEFGTGALNIDGCRVEGAPPPSVPQWTSSGSNNNRAADGRNGQMSQPHDAGRWPTNIVFTHSASCQPIGAHEVRNHGHSPAARGAGGIGTSGHKGQDGLTELRPGTETVEAWSCADDCPVGELDRQSGVLTSGANPERRRSDEFRDAYGEFAGQETCVPHRGAESGGASRFYPTFKYQAKAPASERPRLDDGTAHETVKSLGLMKWMVRLVCPPGGTVLDMFAGSGSTGEACVIEGFRSILIEQDPKSAELIKTRLAKPIQPTLFGLEAS
jgi:hypothetical protein